MTHFATMGAYSCACIALAGWTSEHIKLEQEYLGTGKIGTLPKKETKSFYVKDVPEFYDRILYPTEQPLGRTIDMPFSHLMEQIESFHKGFNYGDNEQGGLRGKFMIAVLNEAQYFDRYWVEKLEKHGFKLIDATKNRIGSTNYIYTRNLNRREITND